MVKYSYNVWGKVSKTVNSGCEQALANNPFMFKGYFYDEESGFYYLKSRYYNPEICRFISMDDIDYLDETSLSGVNLYAYCNNNPVMYADPSGHLPIWAIYEHEYF